MISDNGKAFEAIGKWIKGVKEDDQLIILKHRKQDGSLICKKSLVGGGGGYVLATFWYHEKNFAKGSWKRTVNICWT